MLMQATGPKGSGGGYPAGKGRAEHAGGVDL
jgi:hypothetical protein